MTCYPDSKAKSVVNSLLETDPDDPNAFMQHYVSPFEKFTQSLIELGFVLKDDIPDARYTECMTARWNWTRIPGYEIEVTQCKYNPEKFDHRAEDVPGYEIWAYVYKGNDDDGTLDYDVHAHYYVSTEREALEIVKSDMEEFREMSFRKNYFGY